MIKILLVGLVFFIGISAKADLLDRMRLEDSLRERLQNTFKMYDDTAKILIHLEYKSVEGILPGMSVPLQENNTPDKIEVSDISQANIEIYSKLDKLPDDAKEALEKSLPLENKKKITIHFNTVDTSQFSKPVDAKDLNRLLDKTISLFTKLFALFVLLCGGAIYLVYRLNSKRVNEFRTHFNKLAETISESGGHTPIAVAPHQQERMAQTQQIQLPQANAMFEKLSITALRALFSDSYWCKMDGYAHWLWNQIDMEQKATLLNEIPYMKDYSAYFSEITPAQRNYHEHPYYLDPAQLCSLSQLDVLTIVRKDLSLWHSLSPMRKQTIDLSLDEKLKAIQSTSKKEKFAASAQSPLRTLDTAPTWGDMTFEDELSVFQNPSMVPEKMRHHIRSLVWLAAKDKSYIEKVLSRYDAKTLALAWVGPNEVLKILEQGLPEKKLKLLLTYKEKVTSSRHSDIFQQLVDEGLKNEAA